MFPNLALHYDFGTDPLLLIRADFQRKKPLLKTFCVFSVLLVKKNGRAQTPHLTS